MEISDHGNPYLETYGRIMNIILSDKGVTIEDKQILQMFGKELGITSENYFELLDNYTEFENKQITTRKKRLEDFFRVAELVYKFGKSRQNQISWLEKMGIAMGFSPINIKYIVLKTLDLFTSEEFIDEKVYVDEIENMNR